MKTTIPFYHKVTGLRSDCGHPLNIHFSSNKLKWQGLLVERGQSPYFYPKDVVTPNFYFAIEMKNTYSWQAIKDDSKLQIMTEPGDIWINPPNTPFTHNIDVPCDFLIINISPEKMFSSFEGHLPDGLSFLNNYSIQDETLQHLMYLLLVEVKSGGINGPWYLDHVLALFSNYFIRHFSNYTDLINDISHQSIIGKEEVELVNGYINQHISETIVIEDLAKLLNISKFHFLNEFKKFTGITPYQHILNKRIGLAKKMLSNKANKITAIAFELGFSDSSHFSRTFKKSTGTSPKVYRDQM